MHPPQHSITATIRYLPRAAFDLDRASEERATMPDAGDGHPVVLYFAGETRYDLDAPAHVGDEVRCARDYLRPAHGCPEWEGQRIRIVDVARCRDVGGRLGQVEAFCLGLRAVTGLEGAPPVDGRRITERALDAFVDLVGLDAICDVGEAFLRASEAPKAAEKKR